MITFARIILVVALLLQSIPGLTVASCTTMNEAMSASLPETAISGEMRCACCGAGNPTIGATCPTSTTRAACCCGEPRTEEPRTTPTDRSAEQAHQFIALLPTFLSAIVILPQASTLRRVTENTPPKQSASSTQSLLCVWIV